MNPANPHSQHPLKPADTDIGELFREYEALSLKYRIALIQARELLTGPSEYGVKVREARRIIDTALGLQNPPGAHESQEPGTESSITTAQARSNKE